MRSLQLRFGGIDLRSCGLQRLRQLPVGSREIGLRRAQRVHLILGLEARYHLPGLDPVSMCRTDLRNQLRAKARELLIGS
jgi:hypothetical protein